jgi:hypothetical protein
MYVFYLILSIHSSYFPKLQYRKWRSFECVTVSWNWISVFDLDNCMASKISVSFVTSRIAEWKHFVAH